MYFDGRRVGEFEEYIHYCRCLEFAQLPNYDHLLALLTSMQRKYVGEQTGQLVDWSPLKKVQELGSGWVECEGEEEKEASACSENR